MSLVESGRPWEPDAGWDGVGAPVASDTKRLQREMAFIRANSVPSELLAAPARVATQTKLGSLIEAIVNILIGFTINWLANLAVLPLFGFNVTGSQAFYIGLAFTAISLVRQYVIRRWFNARLHAAAMRMGGAT